MDLTGLSLDAVDWAAVPVTEHPGASGVARWRTREQGSLRLRHVAYSAGYLADHWCRKGHVLLCLAGEVMLERDDGRKVTLRPGMSLTLADDGAPHRVRSEAGGLLFIVD